MQSDNCHIYRDKQEFKRLIQNFGVKPAPETTAKIERMLENQRNKFLKLEESRAQSRSRGFSR